MARTATLPVLNGESGLSRYLAEIRKFPMLEPQQEYMFAKRWREHDDRDAAHHLVTSHLRLVAKIAMGYRGYGLPISEVVSEGNVGLMQAVKRFEPEKGFRLATYAMWWIKAAIQEYPPRMSRLTLDSGSSAARMRQCSEMGERVHSATAAMKADRPAPVVAEHRFLHRSNAGWCELTDPGCGCAHIPTTKA